MILHKTTFVILCLFFCSFNFISKAQNQETKELWKELSKNKFFTVYYDLTSLALAKNSIFDQPVKTEYNSEQKMPGVVDKYFTEIILYSINLDEAKYFIKKATYLNRKKQEIKVFDYTSNGKIDTKQMLPITKGSPVFDLFQIYKSLHSKN